MPSSGRTEETSVTSAAPARSSPASAAKRPRSSACSSVEVCARNPASGPATVPSSAAVDARPLDRQPLDADRAAVLGALQRERRR